MSHYDQTAHSCRELLDRLGLPYLTESPNIDESSLPGETPRETALRLSEMKARAIWEKHPGSVVIGSDQTANLLGEKLGKPHTRERAIEQLSRMQGNTVVFATALCVIDAEGNAKKLESLTTIRMRKLSRETIEAYVDREKPFDCAGSAKIEKLGIADVGVLGTCEYEELLRNGTISRRDFRILEEKPSDGGCVRSTDRYPDAVFSSLPNATSEMVRQITVALLSMPTKSVEFKWTVCNDFVPTFELLRTLKIGPFVALRDTSLAALWERYRTEILLALAFGLAVLFHVITINLLVRRRTRELSESLAQTKRFFMEARDAREKLLRLERASIVSQLSAMFAHEIKQPILNIALYAGSMRLLLRKSGTLTPKAESILDAVQGEIDRSSDIVEHVRGYARHQERDRVPCDLSDIVRQSAAMMTKGHPELKLGALPQSPILADPFEIQFIVENFLRNAFSAVKGSPDAAVLAEVRPFRGGWRLDVLDNGPKLSVEAFRKLGTAGTTTKAEGLGFGLAIARAIAERNGGHLEFRQLGERGLLVSLILPGIDVAADDEAAAEDGSGGRESSTTDRTDRTDEEDGRHA